MPTPHARAVRLACDWLAAAGHSVIAANTDPAADPQIFAQDEDGALAFYFVRADAPAPDDAERARLLALARRHRVSARFLPVALAPAACGPALDLHAPAEAPPR